MDQTPSQSALNMAAAVVRGLWAALLSGFGRRRAAPRPVLVIEDWVNGIFRRLEEMLAQYRAGVLVPCDEVRAADAARGAAVLPGRGERCVSERGAVRGDVTAAAVSADVVAGDDARFEMVGRRLGSVSGFWMGSDFADACRGLGVAVAGCLEKLALGLAVELRLKRSGLLLSLCLSDVRSAVHAASSSP